MTTVTKMKKTELLNLTQALLNNRYCEMSTDSIQDEYEERFNTIVKGV